jgi:N-acetylneuraminic acid mutarotase
VKSKSLFKWSLMAGLAVVILLISLPVITGASESSTEANTTFTYQGLFKLRGRVYSGDCDFQFSLWDAVSDGTQVGTTQSNTITVYEGIFVTELNFGGNAFPGAPRWLEIGVRCPAGGGSYVTLSPRQPLNPTPYASFAHSASWSGLTGVPADLSDGDDDTTYTAGMGLTLAGTEFSVSNVPWSSLTGVPTGLGDGDNDTTYTAGTGLTLAGTEFSVSNVPWSSLAGVPTGLDDGDNDTLSGLSCSTDQIAKWNGTTWACAADDGGGGVPSGAGILTGSQTPPVGYSYSNNKVQLADSGTWVLKPRRPTYTEYAAAAVVNNKIYVIGGQVNSSTMSDATEEYDPATNTWTTKANMPTARVDLAAASTGGKIYAIGGDSSASTYINTVEEYDPATNSWTAKANMPTGRRQLGAAAVGGKIYAIGGRDASGRLATVEEYDPVANTWTTRASMPTARYDLAVVALDGNIYAIGGYGDGVYSDAVEMYDPATNTWTAKASLPEGSYGARAAAMGGEIYVPQDGLVYDPATNIWSFMDSFYTPPGPAVVVDSSLYVLSDAKLQQYVPATYWYLHTKD